MLLQSAAAPDSIQAAARHAQSLADSAMLVRLSAHVDSQYVHYLERTQSTMSLWWTAAGFFVAGIGTLVAVAAIFVGWIMYRQTKEYRETLAKAVEDYRGLAEQHAAEIRIAQESRFAELTAHIQEQREQLDAATGEQRQHIELRIKALEQERVGVAEQITSTATVKSRNSMRVYAPPEVFQWLRSLERSVQRRDLLEAKLFMHSIETTVPASDFENKHEIVKNVLAVSDVLERIERTSEVGALEELWSEALVASKNASTSSIPAALERDLVRRARVVKGPI